MKRMVGSRGKHGLHGFCMKSVEKTLALPYRITDTWKIEIDGDYK